MVGLLGTFSQGRWTRYRLGHVGTHRGIGAAGDLDYARAMSERASGDGDRRLIEAGMVLASELSLDAVLQRIVELAVDLTGARYGALGVLTPGGRSCTTGNRGGIVHNSLDSHSASATMRSR